jgi:hypothetical protein
MFLKPIRALAIVTIMTSPAACVTSGPDSPSIFGASKSNIPVTPAEARLREDNKIFNETILGGVATGAVIGAVACGLFSILGGNSKNAVENTVACAVVGGIAGGIDGWRVATQQEAARKQIGEIDQITYQIKEENSRTRQSISNVDLVIADTTRSLRGARAGYRSQQVSLEEMRQREKRAERNIAQIDELIGNMEERNGEYQQVAETLNQEGKNTREIDREIEETQILLAKKKRERDLLEEELVQGRIG